MADLKQDVLEIIGKKECEVRGDIRKGCSVSHVIQELRCRGWKRVNEDSLINAGFKIMEGKVGKSTKLQANKICAPAWCVVV